MHRPRFFSSFCLLMLATCLGDCIVATAVENNVEQNPGTATEVFISRYCFRCHGAEEQKGQRRFDQLSLDSLSGDELFEIQDVIDQLTLEDMPPEGAEQPTPTERKSAIQVLTKQLASVRAKQRSTGRQTVLRRLNRREYLNTVGDLFDMEMSMFDPTTEFPRDNTIEHLDNVGDALVTSGYLLEQYIEAADEIVEKAFADIAPEPVHSWTFRGNFKQQPELNPAHEEAFDYRYLCLYDNPLAERPEGAYGPLEEFHEGVPVDGVYEVRVLAQAMNRDSPYGSKLLQIDLDEPFRMGIVPGNAEAGSMHTIQPIQPLLAETVIADGEPKWYTLKVPLDRGFSPRFTFQNGMVEVRPTYRRVMRRFRETLPKRSREAKGIFRERKALIKDGLLPHIRIHEVEIHGPLEKTWPPKPQQAVLGDQPFTEERSPRLLAEFASKAYRRPVKQDEIDRLLRLVAIRRSEGADALSAFQDAVKAILCSPAFLYLQPIEGPPHPGPSVSEPQQSSSYALASRLSYFLWASMPDDRLFELAGSGAINQPAVLREQVRRMLADPKSEAFITGFLNSWLNLRALGEMPPDRKAFAEYYADGLREEMKRETSLFMRHLIDNDLPAVEFLTADYSFVNRDLAKAYDARDMVPVEDAQRFRKVTFDNANRGGLLGQASILTVTANGIETSPVIRGVWVLENLLGTPPPPPPDDVPAIDPDVRGATTIRDLLSKHRSIAACNECHRKIDPLGFALERFDPIGRERDEYPNGAVIDTSGKLPSGQSFDGVAELKDLLAERDEFFVRALTERMIAYATGRRIEEADRQPIDEILASLEKKDYPLHSLIEEVVVSDLFRR